MKDKYREGFKARFDDTAKYPLTLGESLMLHAAWDTAWNLATAIANGEDMTLVEALPINYDKDK